MLTRLLFHHRPARGNRIQPHQPIVLRVLTLATRPWCHGGMPWVMGVGENGHGSSKKIIPEESGANPQV
ncbi:MAG: hypothetical protein ACKO5P_08520 [Nodosilinea sp.]